MVFQTYGDKRCAIVGVARASVLTQDSPVVFRRVPPIAASRDLQEPSLGEQFTLEGFETFHGQGLAEAGGRLPYRLERAHIAPLRRVGQGLAGELTQGCMCFLPVREAFTMPARMDSHSGDSGV